MLLACTVQGSAAQTYFKQFMATVEGALGSLPDWKSAGFWRDSRFVRAWSRAREGTLRYGAVGEIVLQDRSGEPLAGYIGNPCLRMCACP